MSKPSKVVLDYLMENVDLTNSETLIDRLQEISEFYATVPSEVIEANKKLTAAEKWELIRHVAAKGKSKMWIVE
ncbi:hypothetical protein MKY96_32475 [Paenibacillus sp. FSL R7-0302]|uniref:hypothetical protein n=1 Tax=Paenibacillus sp. FSL R7-0302 TaxID=2921681 RepID=UPI0030F5EF12